MAAIFQTALLFGSPAMYLAFRARACDPSLAQRSGPVLFARDHPVSLAGVVLKGELNERTHARRAFDGYHPVVMRNLDIPWVRGGRTEKTTASKQYTSGDDAPRNDIIDTTMPAILHGIPSGRQTLP